jgi:hypothetical protein
MVFRPVRREVAAMQDIDAEFRRIGFEPGELPGLVISGTKEEFLAWLLTVPSGIGLAGFERLLPQHQPPQRPVWDEWPDVGDLFSPDEYRAAFQFINRSPAHLVESTLTPAGRRVDTVVLALLSHLSPDAAERVARFRQSTHEQRLAAGVPAQDLLDGEVVFENWRTSLADQVADYREWEALAHGPIVWIRFHMLADQEDIGAVLAEIRDLVAPTTRMWSCEPHMAGTTGAVNFVANTSRPIVLALVRHLHCHAMVTQVSVQWQEHDAGPDWPMPVFEDDADEPW